jgi:hypothetical protein
MNEKSSVVGQRAVSDAGTLKAAIGIGKSELGFFSDSATNFNEGKIFRNFGN